MDAILYAEVWVEGAPVAEVAPGQRVEYRVVVNIEATGTSGWSVLLDRLLPEGLQQQNSPVYSRTEWNGTLVIYFYWTETATESYEVRTAVFDDGSQISEGLSETLTIAPPLAYKIADLTINYIKVLPLDDKTVLDNVTATVNTLLKTYALVGEDLWVGKAALVFTGNVAGFIPNYEYRAEIYSKGSPFPWLAFIAGLIAGIIIAGISIYWISVRPKEVALQEVARTTGEVIADIDKLVAEGKLSPEDAAPLKDKLEEAKKTAEEAGTDWIDEWMKMLKPVMELMPIIIIAVVAFTVIGGVMSIMPQRR